MTDYKRMYCALCAAASAALDLLPEREENRAGREALQKALDEAEEIYIATVEEPEDP